MSDVKRYTAWAAEVALPRGTMVVLAADYDALAAELATERLRADAAVGDVNAAGRCVAELEGLLREVSKVMNKTVDWFNGEFSDSDFDQSTGLAEAHAGISIAAYDVSKYLASQPQQGEPCEFHGDDLAACQMYSGQVPCEPEPKAEQPAAVDELRIVFDGPPGPESGRFVEVEDSYGRSINAGQWRQRDDGLWELVIARAALAPAAIAVVMPARMTTIPEGKTISYAAGYEAALDAVTNLNRNTVSLELLERALSENDSICRTLALRELRAILGAKP